MTDEEPLYSTLEEARRAAIDSRMKGWHRGYTKGYERGRQSGLEQGWRQARDVRAISERVVVTLPEPEPKKKWVAIPFWQMVTYGATIGLIGGIINSIAGALIR